MGGSLITPVYADAAPLCYIDELVTGIFDKIWPFIGIAVFAMFLYGGFMWMFSAGDSQKVAKASSTMFWAFAGILILSLVMVIMGTFETLFGIPERTLSVFNLDCLRVIIGA